MNGFESTKKIICFFGIVSALYLYAPTATADSQVGDEEWMPTVTSPEYLPGEGPLVLVDAGHGNFHTIDGRYAAFADLLKLDGYRVQSATGAVTAESLSNAGVFVISNAILGGHDAEWTLPIHSAFTAEEIAVIADWVDSGGSLLLIADHMPFPGATAELAETFGVVFYNGFAMQPRPRGGTLTFTRDSGSLADHAITRGRSDSEKITSLTSFTGQAFRIVSGMQPLMFMPDDWHVLMPVEAWEFDASTPSVSARGLVQGGAMQHGKGRVAVFGEAAMFTAQTSVRDGEVRRMGMSHPAAPENAQFVLNVLHWLSGRLDQ